jgi:eukaryotic-like serine/threonine-protein kinase
LAVDLGTVLKGKYRVDALLGRGGMGQVFAATDLDDHRQIAVKVVSRLMFDPMLMARLHREAEAAARIRSDYVPRVFDVEETDDGEVFLVMERLVGEPLSQRVREGGLMPWPEVAGIAEDILRGLIDAHTAGIVHRDLKPSNVFLAIRTGRMRAMILDFGVCKIDTTDVERLTGTGESIGTVAYMAPEQIRGASRVDDRADLYAFGALVFEMLTGRLPHEGATQMAILASKLEKTPARLAEHARVPVPDGLDALVTRALAREPAERFSSAQELLKAFRALGASDLVAAPPTSTPRGWSSPVGASDPEPLADLAPSRATGRAWPHGTQTAMTAGISLRRGGTAARAAFLLAAVALGFGAMAVIAAIVRAPDPPPAGAAAAEEATPSEAPPVTDAVINLGDDPGDPGGLGEIADLEREVDFELASTEESERGPVSDGGVAPLRRKASRPRAPVRSSPPAPHITPQPRY